MFHAGPSTIESLRGKTVLRPPRNEGTNFFCSVPPSLLPRSSEDCFFAITDRQTDEFWAHGSSDCFRQLPKGRRPRGGREGGGHRPFGRERERTFRVNGGLCGLLSPGASICSRGLLQSYVLLRANVCGICSLAPSLVWVTQAGRLRPSVLLHLTECEFSGSTTFFLCEEWPRTLES